MVHGTLGLFHSRIHRRTLGTHGIFPTTTPVTTSSSSSIYSNTFRRYFSEIKLNRKPPATTSSLFPYMTTGILFIGGSTATAVYWLGYDISDIKQIIGLEKSEYTAQEEAEMRALEAEGAPLLRTPDEFDHPYDSKPFYWRLWFKFRRYIFLLTILFPVLCQGLYIYLIDNSPKAKRAFCDFFAASLEKGGCSLHKFGQWISMRPDMFEAVLVESLARLRTDAPSHDFAFTQQMIRESFNCEIEDIFESFDEKPVASGSVAQVHHAVLRKEYTMAGGIREVAVKVRHPYVLDETYIDIEFVFRLAPLLSVVGGQVSLPFSIEGFHHCLQQQLDFKWEAHNLANFARNFAKEMCKENGTIRFPRVNPKFLSESILVESWASGTTVSDWMSRPENADPLKRAYYLTSEGNYSYDPSVAAAKLTQGPVEQPELTDREKKVIAIRTKLSETLFDMNMKMFLRDNLIHADLHSGNLIFDEDTGEVTVVDAGMAVTLESNDLAGFGDFMRAAIDGDSRVMAEKLLEFHDSQANSESQQPNERAVLELVQSTVSHFEQYGYPPKSGTKLETDEVTIGDVVGNIVKNLSKENLVLKASIASALLTISISEGLILEIESDFDLITKALPYFVRYKQWASVDSIMAAGYETTKAVTKEAERKVTTIKRRASTLQRHASVKIKEVTKEVQGIKEKVEKTIDEQLGGSGTEQ